MEMTKEEVKEFEKTSNGIILPCLLSEDELIKFFTAPLSN